VYARISSDRDGDHLGVTRQVEDCERLVARKGWGVAERYVDDDVSAYKGRVRPAYKRMLDDLRGGGSERAGCAHGQWRAVEDAKGPNDSGCGHTYIGAETLELFVVEAVLHRLDSPELATVLNGSRDDPDAERVRFRG